jgi:16S rRNA (uracil1498-N3)-methyltransferase
MARFFLPRRNIIGGIGIIDGPELDHLRKVLRLQPGDRIKAFDDGGWEHEAIIHAVASRRAEIEIVSSRQADRESPLHLTLALGLTKGEKIDLVVEKATELGVKRIIPFASSHAVPKLDERKVAARTERWQKIALSAVKQCGRTETPQIVPLMAFENMLRSAKADDAKLLCWEMEAQRSLGQAHEQLRDAKALFIAIGPEGGFSLSEADLAQQHGFERVHLGRRILRAETAAIAALSLAQFLWGDLG